MAQNLTPEVIEALKKSGTSLTTIWKILPRRLREFPMECYTELDRDITVRGLTYKSFNGVDTSAFARDTGLNVETATISGVIDDPEMRLAIVNGALNYARIQAWIVDWRNPPTEVLPTGAEDTELIHAFKGTFGKVNISETTGHYSVEIRGLAEPLQSNLLRYYERGCDADFGDMQRCFYPIDSATSAVTVTVATNNALFTISPDHLDYQRMSPDGAPIGPRYNEPILRIDNTYQYGLLTWLTGANAGLSQEIKGWSGSALQMELTLPMNRDIVAGDTCLIRYGCDKTIAQCRKYQQVHNFRGFPYVPGASVITANEPPPLDGE